MRVLHIGKYYPPVSGGIEQVTFDLSQSDKNQSFDVLCINNDNRTIKEKLNLTNIVRSAQIGFLLSTPISFDFIRRIIKACRNYNAYDIIHLHLPNPLATIAVLIGNPKCKLLLHWHSDIIKQKYTYALYKPIQKLILKKANIIVTTTPKYGEESKQLSSFKDKVKPIAIGIDRERFIVNKSKLDQLKYKYKGKKVIFSIGRMVYYKGFQYLIDAAKHLPNDYHIVIAGKGELYPSFLQYVKAEKLEEKVSLVGYVPDDEVGAYYALCDVFCLPSIEKTEAFGLVLIEAMSFSKPVIATKIKGSGVDWVNKDGISGVNVNPKSSTELAKALVNVLSNESLYKKLAVGALKRYESAFTKKKMAQSFRSLYKSLM